jgi:hypothetical protein
MSFASVLSQIERQHAFVVNWTFEDFRVTQGSYRIVIPGAPVIIHASPGEFVVF